MPLTTIRVSRYTSIGELTLSLLSEKDEERPRVESIS